MQLSNLIYKYKNVAGLDLIRLTNQEFWEEIKLFAFN